MNCSPDDMMLVKCVFHLATHVRVVCVEAVGRFVVDEPIAEVLERFCGTGELVVAGAGGSVTVAVVLEFQYL